MKGRWAAVAVAAVGVWVGAARVAEGVTHTAVPISGAQDVIVDDAHHQVLVTTGGSVQRYSLTGHAMLSPWNVGVNLRSIDLTADGAFAYIVEQTAGPAQGIVRKVNTGTGAVTNLFYNLAGEGAGGYDIVRLGNNRMLFTANNQFSGASSVVRFIDLSNDAITVRQNPGGGGGSDATERQTDLFRSAGGGRVFMTGGNTSAGNVRVYDTATDSYLVNTNLWAPLNGISAALSPDGSLLAFQGYNVSLSLVHSADLSLANVFPSYRSGLGFGPGGYLFMADWQTELFRVYDPGTQTEVAEIPAGFDLDPFITGNIVFSADGGTMVYQDINGMHIYEGVPVPEPAALAVWGVGAVVVAGRWRGRRGRGV